MLQNRTEQNRTEQNRTEQNWSDWTSVDNESHKMKCKVCDRKIMTDRHNFEYHQKDANNHTKVCSQCHYNIDENHTNNGSTVSFGNEYHGKQCSLCNENFDQEKHTFVDDTCTECGEQCDGSSNVDDNIIIEP